MLGFVLKKMHGEVFDMDAVIGGSQGCWIECLTGMLNSFFTGMLEYLVKNCCTRCLTGMLNEVFDTDAGSIFDRSVGCFRELMDQIFDRDAQ